MSRNFRICALASITNCGIYLTMQDHALNENLSFPGGRNIQPYSAFNSRLVGQKFSVESLDEIGTILTQHGAGRSPWPAEISVKVQGTEEPRLLPLICGHRGTDDGGHQLLLLRQLRVHVPHVNGALVQRSVLQIARHWAEVLRQVEIVVCARQEMSSGWDYYIKYYGLSWN